MLKGIGHVHSTFSFDGKVELAEVHAFFAARGFDFVLMSEHVEHLDLARMQHIYDSCLRVSDSRCVLIPGIEIDDLHILIFGIQRPESFDGNLPFTLEAHRGGALIVLSHPVKIRKGIPDAVRPLLAGVEVWNSRYDGRRAPRPASLALFRELQAVSPQLAPFCGVDFHRQSDFSGVSLAVDAASRSPSDIVAALRASRFRICNHGKPIPIYADSSAWARALYGVKNRGFSACHDATVAVYRRLKASGIRMPAPLRRAIKRWI